MKRSVAAIDDRDEALADVLVGLLQLDLMKVGLIAVVRASVGEEDGAGSRGVHVVDDGGFAVGDVVVVAVFAELVLVGFGLAYLHEWIAQSNSNKQLQ